MIRNASREKGVTLVEILVASFLLVLIGLVCWALFRSSIDASSTGYVNIKIQENARHVMDTLLSEIRQTVKPPMIIGTTAKPYPSGILYPCTNDPDTNTDPDANNRNRVIFLEVVGLDGFSFSYTPNLQNYRAVEYRVFPADTTRNSRIVRRVWANVQDATCTTCIRGLNYTISTGFDFNPGAYETLTSEDKEEIVLELPFRNDRMELFVSHALLPSGMYDYKVYQISYTLEQTLNNNPNRKKELNMKSEVKLP